MSKENTGDELEIQKLQKNLQSAQNEAGEWVDEDVELGDDFDFALLANSIVQPSELSQLSGGKQENLETQLPQANLTDLLQSITSTLHNNTAQIDAESISVAGCEPIETAADTGTRHILFEAGGQLFGLPLTGVREIDRFEKVTLLPRTPSWLRGLTNLRGQILSVTDLCELVGLPSRNASHSEKIIVVTSDKFKTSTAFVVERVHGIRSVNAEPLQREDASNATAKYAYGMAMLEERIELHEEASNVILLLDPDLLLGCETLSMYSTNQNETIA